MSTTSISLSSVEQALVTEVANWAALAQREIQAAVNAKLACVLDAHSLNGKTANFRQEDGKWVLVVEEEQDATQEGNV